MKPRELQKDRSNFNCFSILLFPHQIPPFLKMSVKFEDMHKHTHTHRILSCIGNEGVQECSFHY